MAPVAKKCRVITLNNVFIRRGYAIFAYADVNINGSSQRYDHKSWLDIEPEWCSNVELSHALGIKLDHNEQFELVTVEIVPRNCDYTFKAKRLTSTRYVIKYGRIKAAFRWSLLSRLLKYNNLYENVRVTFYQ